MAFTQNRIDQLDADEAMHEWIRERVGYGVEPGTLEWEDATHQYLLHLAYDPDDDFGPELARLTQDDLAYVSFCNQMTYLERDLPDAPSESLLKMTYSYSVTLMETCLGDMIKGVVLSDEHFLKNAITSVTDLKAIKLSLMDFYSDGDIVRKIVLNTLSDYLYHKIEKIVSVYSAILGEKTPDNVRNNMPSVISISKVRHDIVHRNGMDKDGNYVALNKAVLIQAMKDINEFVGNMKVSIVAATFNRESNPVP